MRQLKRSEGIVDTDAPFCVHGDLFVRNACGFFVSLVDWFYLIKWNLLCICMSGISPQIPSISYITEEGRVKCRLWDMKSDKIDLSNLKLTKTNICFIL